MKRYSAILIVALVFVPATFAEVVEAVLARVGDRIVTRSSYLHRLDMGLRELSESIPPDQIEAREAKFRENLLQDMIDELVVKDRADRVGLTVSDKEVNDAIKRLQEQYGIATDAAFDQSLAESGMTRVQLERRLRDTILTNKLFGKELRPPAQMSDRELRQMYDREKEKYRLPERARIREIVIMKPQGATSEDIEAAHQRADQAASRARKGEEFATVATEVSEAPSRAKGGSLGTIAKNELIKEIDTAVFQSKAKDIVGPIESTFGFHVILVEERLPEILPSFESIKETLKTESTEEVYQRDLRLYLEGLRKDAYVVVFEERVQQLSAEN